MSIMQTGTTLYNSTTSNNSSYFGGSATQGIGGFQQDSMNQIYQTDSTSGGYIYTQPVSPTYTALPVYIQQDQDNLKSKPTPVEEHAHEIQCCFRVEALEVVVDYKCHHCDTVLFSKVICKIPKKIRKQKCLAKIVKGV